MFWSYSKAGISNIGIRKQRETSVSTSPKNAVIRKCYMTSSAHVQMSFGSDVVMVL